MSPTEKQKLLADVLAWVNEVRADNDLPALPALRRGRAGSHCECPIARSLRGGRINRTWINRVDYVLWKDERLLFEGDTPHEVAVFIVAFDEGKFPELDAVAA